MHSLVAYYQSVDPGGVLVPINAVPDQHVLTQGADIRVPKELPNIIGQAALANDATLARAQLTSPSLRALALLDMEPLVAALLFGSPPEGLFHGDSPIPLEGIEALNLLIQSDPVAAAVHQGLVWLSDGAIQPVKGKIYTIRATGSAALAAGVWVNTALVFSQTLPVGRYQVVGMRARGANLVAARLVFIGYQWRPGVPAVNAIADLDPISMRYGNFGSFGEFDSVTPPTLDCLGTVDTVQVVELDIIKMR